MMHVLFCACTENGYFNTLSSSKTLVVINVDDVDGSLANV